MYRFCKIDLFGKVSTWTLEIDSFEKYREWNDKFQLKYISEGAENIKKRFKTWEEQSKGTKYPEFRLLGHWTTDVGYLSEKVGDMDGKIDLVKGFGIVTDDLITSKYNALKREGIIYVYEGCEWFVRPNVCSIVDIIDKTEMKYPKYSKEDIKVFKWERGTHYYAKIGSNEVIDEDRNNKWKTYDYAYQKALDALTKY